MCRHNVFCVTRLCNLHKALWGEGGMVQLPHPLEEHQETCVSGGSIFRAAQCASSMRLAQIFTPAQMEICDLPSTNYCDTSEPELPLSQSLLQHDGSSLSQHV